MLLKPYWKFFHSFYFLKTTEVGYNSFLKFIAMKRIILFCLSFFYSNFIFSQNGYAPTLTANNTADNCKIVVEGD